MKLKELITDIYTQTGLWFINQIARTVPCEVRRGLAYGAAPRQKLDHYLLPNSESRPTVFFLYGGNWRSGHRADYRFVADTLMSLGCNVIIPDYRLYPLVRFDDIRQDAAEAFTYACDLAAKDQPMIILGHSAGAQLGALLSLDETILAKQYRDRISRFIGLAGPYDFFPFTEDDHWDLFAPEHAYPRSQVVNYVRAGGPPLYLLHGAEDRRVRRGHSKSLMEKQQAADGVASREVYPGVGHVEIILAFSRLHRKQSAVIRDIRSILQDEFESVFDAKAINIFNEETTNTHFKEATDGAQ